MEDSLFRYWLLTLMAALWGVDSIVSSLRISKGKAEYNSLFERLKLSRLNYLKSKKKTIATKKNALDRGRQKQVAQQLMFFGCIYLLVALFGILHLLRVL